MGPRGESSPSDQAGLPRTRGDGPKRKKLLKSPKKVAPHTRGWAPIQRHRAKGCEGCPAHAGMGPDTHEPRPAQGWLPRTRGDGPCPSSITRGATAVAPHTRGWALATVTARISATGCPAHAGMGPSATDLPSGLARLPRTRGDGPTKAKALRLAQRVAPHTRGWAQKTMKALADRDGCPAHAGMGPARSAVSTKKARLPRTRGDGPTAALSKSTGTSVAPHTRGWATGFARGRGRVRGCPAHAGMGPDRRRYRPRSVRLPRTRGDGPVLRNSELRKYLVAPHTRGWAHREADRGRAGHGCPAHAGMGPRHS